MGVTFDLPAWMNRKQRRKEAAKIRKALREDAKSKKAQGKNGKT